MLSPVEYEPPPLSKLEMLVLEAVPYERGVGLDEQCDRVRNWLRDEVARKLALAARRDQRIEEAVQAPTPRDLAWVGRLDTSTRDGAIDAVAALR